MKSPSCMVLDEIWGLPVRKTTSQVDCFKLLDNWGHQSKNRLSGLLRIRTHETRHSWVQLQSVARFFSSSERSNLKREVGCLHRLGCRYFVVATPHFIFANALYSKKSLKYCGVAMKRFGRGRGRGNEGEDKIENYARSGRLGG